MNTNASTRISIVRKFKRLSQGVNLNHPLTNFRNENPIRYS